MNHTVHVLPFDIYVQCAHGELISEVLKRTKTDITYPCGGKGTCQHCKVHMGDKSVLACQTPIDSDCLIVVPSRSQTGNQEILTDIRLYDFTKNGAPRIETLTLELTQPTLEDSVADATRLTKALSELTGCSSISIDLSCLQQLPHFMRKKTFLPVSVLYEKDSLTVVSLDEKVYGLAIDVGTTTLVTALCDLSSGQVLGSVGTANPQAQFGSDVISRIMAAEESTEKKEQLQHVLIQAIGQAIAELRAENHIEAQQILLVTIAGNTVMSHLLLGLPCEYLRREPYVPAATMYPDLRARDLEFPIAPDARILILPAISSYVGGDITAGMIATRLGQRDGIHMLIDIGTNGEIVLSGEGFQIACSSSAGPAFEGSGISCGSRAIPGAIDRVSLVGNEFVFDVIGDKEPESICGSGLISLLPAMLEKGIINRAGRFTSGQEYALTSKISITEADVLNLIRAKGAIFAGIRMLLRSMDLSFSDIDSISIAGGFGRTLSIEAGIAIGMLPPVDPNLYSYEGNSSLSGALMVLNDRTIDCQAIAQAVMNIELSVGNEFMDEFVKACFLPHTELDFSKD
jgi:uncharacterized 2Fe-2S/4Fe-4S cluster protein (DUF4445 family)